MEKRPGMLPFKRFFLGMFIINVLLNSYGTHGIFQKKLESRLVKSWEEF